MLHYSFGSVKMIDKVHFVSFFNGLLLYCLYDTCKYTTKKGLYQVLRKIDLNIVIRTNRIMPDFRERPIAHGIHTYMYAMELTEWVVPGNRPFGQ